MPTFLLLVKPLFTLEQFVMSFDRSNRITSRSLLAGKRTVQIGVTLILQCSVNLKK